jgi:hypothetical protein
MKYYLYRCPKCDMSLGFFTSSQILCGDTLYCPQEGCGLIKIPNTKKKKLLKILKREREK